MSAAIHVQPAAIAQKFSGHGNSQGIDARHQTPCDFLMKLLQIVCALDFIGACPQAVVNRGIFAFGAEDTLMQPYSPSICLN